MTTFFLFRLTIERPHSLFDDQTLSSRQVILDAIEKKGSHSRRNGPQWRIGNLQKLNGSSVFFALGKITQKTLQLYDNEAGDFVEAPFDEAPHTYVVVDLEYQICAIARKTIVSQTPNGAATNLKRILNAAHEGSVDRAFMKFALSPIDDPEEFLDLIRSAHRVSEFTVQFSLPNPIDVERQYMRPMEQCLRHAHGEKGETTLRGPHLNPELLEELTRSAASSGNPARARIQSSPNGRLVAKRSVGSQASVAVEEIATDDDKLSLAERVRSAYRTIRRSRN